MTLGWRACAHAHAPACVNAHAVPIHPPGGASMRPKVHGDIHVHVPRLSMSMPIRPCPHPSAREHIHARAQVCPDAHMEAEKFLTGSQFQPRENMDHSE